MVKHGVRLELNDGVAGFRQSADGSLEVLTSSGKCHPADIVILAIGVRPETAPAKMTGIEIGQRGETPSTTLRNSITMGTRGCGNVSWRFTSF
jgi:NADPH-dependent 2,4-dienoyl-CoA reductase/sulfur reductase-like enzyme